jgi:hypothetical protein
VTMMSSSTSRHTHGINKMYITDINNISQKEKCILLLKKWSSW